MANLLQDLRHAFRQLLRRPIFTATAVLTLAIGMGVNVVAFSVVNGLLFKGFNTSAHPGIGRIAISGLDDPDANASLAELERFTDSVSSVAEVAAEGRSSVPWKSNGQTQPAWVLYVTPNYFSMVNATVLAGSLRVAPGNGGQPTAVIGERFWREKLGSASLAGLTLQLNGTDVAVAGLIPESFTGPAGIYSPDVWLPLHDLPLFSSSPALKKRDSRWLFVMARPKPGVTMPEVQGHVDAAVAAMAREWPDTHKGHPAKFFNVGEPNGERRGLGVAAGIGMGIIGLVLLLACFNVANLLLARAVERERDMGIRTALGAKPGRLMRLVITEGFLIAVISGGLALVLATWTQSIMGSFAIPIDQPQHIDLSADTTVVAFIGVLIMIAGVLPGLWPALSAARVNVLQVLGSQGANAVGARPSAMRQWLVGAQITGSTAFLAIAALFVQSVDRIVDLDLGFNPHQIAVLQIEPAASGLDTAAAQRYAEAAVTRVKGVPGVVDAAAIDRAPFFIGYDRRTPVWPDGGTCAGDTCPQVSTFYAGDGYFRAMGVRMAAGREFDDAAAGTDVIVNQAFAKQQWGDGRGLGETIRVGENGAVLTVVGVTASHLTRGLDRERPTLYLPLEPATYERSLTIVARSGDPAAIVRPMLDAAQGVDSRVPVLVAKTMTERMSVQTWPFRTLSRVFTLCGMLALLLATAGLAASVIHAVSRRQREFGVRLSIGATPRDLAGGVLRQGMWLLIPGFTTGVLIAAAVARLAQAIFLGVNVLDPLTYVVVGLIECAVVMVACLGPALRASRVDPLVALRAE
jgi:macrolide transport system ATP-binding/permease protein